MQAGSYEHEFECNATDCIELALGEGFSRQDRLCVSGDRSALLRTDGETNEPVYTADVFPIQLPSRT